MSYIYIITTAYNINKSELCYSEEIKLCQEFTKCFANNNIRDSSLQCVFDKHIQHYVPATSDVSLANLCLCHLQAAPDAGTFSVSTHHTSRTINIMQSVNKPDHIKPHPRFPSPQARFFPSGPFLYSYFSSLFYYIPFPISHVGVCWHDGSQKTWHALATPPPHQRLAPQPSDISH